MYGSPRWVFVPFMCVEMTSDPTSCKRPGIPQSSGTKRQATTLDSFSVSTFNHSLIEPSITTLLDALRREANNPPSEELCIPTIVVPTLGFCNQTTSFF